MVELEAEAEAEAADAAAAAASAAADWMWCAAAAAAAWCEWCDWLSWCIMAALVAVALVGGDEWLDGEWCDDAADECCNDWLCALGECRCAPVAGWCKPALWCMWLGAAAFACTICICCCCCCCCSSAVAAPFDGEPELSVDATEPLWWFACRRLVAAAACKAPGVKFELAADFFLLFVDNFRLRV